VSVISALCDFGLFGHFWRWFVSVFLPHWSWRKVWICECVAHSQGCFNRSRSRNRSRDRSRDRNSDSVCNVIVNFSGTSVEDTPLQLNFTSCNSYNCDSSPFLLLYFFSGPLSWLLFSFLQTFHSLDSNSLLYPLLFQLSISDSSQLQSCNASYTHTPTNCLALFSWLLVYAYSAIGFDTFTQHSITSLFHDYACTPRRSDPDSDSD
jgi:hypothetical protein